jgi:hypothetical protein
MQTQRTTFVEVDPLGYGSAGFYDNSGSQVPQNFVTSPAQPANKGFTSGVVLTQPANLDIQAVGGDITRVPFGDPNDPALLAERPRDFVIEKTPNDPTPPIGPPAPAPAPAAKSGTLPLGSFGGGFSSGGGAGKFDNLPAETAQQESKEFDYKGFISKYGKTIATVVLLGVFLYIASKYFSK